MLWRSMRLIIAAAAVLIVAAAVTMRIVEPAQFPDIGISLYWAVVTVATVGYGDIVPVTPAGRFVTTVVILFAMAWLPTVTGLVVSTLLDNMQAADRNDAQARLASIEEKLEHLVAAASADVEPDA